MKEDTNSNDDGEDEDEDEDKRYMHSMLCRKTRFARITNTHTQDKHNEYMHAQTKRISTLVHTTIQASLTYN